MHSSDTALHIKLRDTMINKAETLTFLIIVEQAFVSYIRSTRRDLSRGHSMPRNIICTSISSSHPKAQESRLKHRSFV